MCSRRKPLVSRLFIVISILILLISIYVNSFYSSQTNQNDINLLKVDYPITSATKSSTIVAHSTNSTRSSRAEYSYHNYTSFVSDLKNLNNTYPDLLDIYTTQDKFGIPDAYGGYKIWVARITNEKLGDNKPEVFFVGGHHGDEDISIEAPYFLIEFLLENYETNPHIRYLLDHREIYIMPVVNPWGWENNIREDFAGEDMNRDYPYGIEGGNTPLTTVGARSVAELMKRHAFILSLTWHSGLHAIYYAWGTPKHDTPTDESPDNIAFFEVAKLMSDYAGGNTKYPYGPANQVVYYAEGAWSDYAYAGTWDTNYMATGYDTPGARSLAIGVEISNNKVPAQSALGNSDQILNPGTNIGFIPQNIRMALVMIDLAEPYITWTNQGPSKSPNQVNANSNITLNWTVNGTFSVTETKILYGTDPDPINNFQFNTSKLSGGSVWSGETFSQNITVPNEPGDYYFVAYAKVDQSALIQTSPEPDIPPQSFFVQQRTNDSWSITIDGNTIDGKKDWYSSIIHIDVIGDVEEKIRITDYSIPAYCNEMFNIYWEVKTDQELSLNDSHLLWGQNNDLINHSEFTTSPSNMSNDTDNKTVRFFANSTLPAKPGYYYFLANFNSQDQSALWSRILKLEVKPRIPYRLQVSLPKIEYIGDYDQTLSLTGITCMNQNISAEPLDDSFMSVSKTSIIGFDNDTKKIIAEQEQSFNLKWSSDYNSWYLPKINISTWNEGWYLVLSKFEHKYGSGQSTDKIDDDIPNWFKLEHIITVSKPLLKLTDNKTKTLDLLNVTARSSKTQIGIIDDLEASNHSYGIYALTIENLEFGGTLEWSVVNQSWYAQDINLTTLAPGNYFVICKFSAFGIGDGESVHSAGDQTEFTITSDSNGDKNDEDDSQALKDEYIIAIVFVLIFMIILFFLMVFLRIRKTH